MNNLDRKTIILISITVGVMVGLISGALSNLVTGSFSFGPVLSFWFGVVMSVMSGVTIFLEIKRRRSEEQQMCRAQVILISAMVGLVAALFTLVVAEPDVKIRATIISGLSFAVIFYLLINRDQSGFAGKRVEDFKRDQRQNRKK